MNIRSRGEGVIEGVNIEWVKPEGRLVSPDISCSARNADRPERRLAVGFVAAMPVKAD